MNEYEFFDHTADIGLRVHADSIEGLFKISADALFGLISDFKPPKSIQKEINLNANSSEDLLVAWLNELLAQVFADNFFPAEYNIHLEDIGPEKTLRAEIWGEAINNYQGKIKTEVKAATYHDLKVAKSTEGGYLAEVILDI